MDDVKRRLIWHGIFLFLLGLLTGFVVQQFKNPRMGLAAHLEGVMNGTFLIALGAAWAHVRLSPRLETAAYWSGLYATYGNWLTTTLAAIFGYSVPHAYGRDGPQRSALARGNCDGRLRVRCDNNNWLLCACSLGRTAGPPDRDSLTCCSSAL